MQFIQTANQPYDTTHIEYSAFLNLRVTSHADLRSSKNTNNYCHFFFFWRVSDLTTGTRRTERCQPDLRVARSTRLKSLRVFAS